MGCFFDSLDIQIQTCDGQVFCWPSLLGFCLAFHWASHLVFGGNPHNNASSAPSCATLLFTAVCLFQLHCSIDGKRWEHWWWWLWCTRPFKPNWHLPPHQKLCQTLDNKVATNAQRIVQQQNQWITSNCQNCPPIPNWLDSMCTVLGQTQMHKHTHHLFPNSSNQTQQINMQKPCATPMGHETAMGTNGLSFDLCVDKFEPQNVEQFSWWWSIVLVFDMASQHVHAPITCNIQTNTALNSTDSPTILPWKQLWFQNQSKIQT